MDINLFDYGFDEGLIAKYPRTDRGEARLLAVDVKNFKIGHRKFYEITDYINKNDVTVVNDSRVRKARIFGKRATGGGTEIFVSEFPRVVTFPLKLRALLKSHKTIREGEELAVFKKGPDGGGNADTAETRITALKNCGAGAYEILIKTEEDYRFIFEKCAEIPLPPYIKREPEEIDDEYYQTVYAGKSGCYSVAAPTAGLHFTDEIIRGVREKGGIFTGISLNIGLGTFLPVRAGDIKKHEMHAETYSITEEAASIINGAAGSGAGKIILTGTSTIRCLESSFSEHGKAACGTDMKTDLYIYPGYEFKITRNLITNFHQPKSSLYIMICALIGIEKTKAVYEEAVRNGYSLFSYGDAMYLYNI